MILLNLVWPLLGSGPLLSRYKVETVDNCYTHWWATLLHVSNWLHPRDMCLRQSWFFSADFQFHLIMFFFLVGFVFSPRKSLIASGFMVLLGIIIPAAIVYHFDLPPTTLLNEVDIE